LPVVADQTINELTLLTVTNTAFETNIHVTLGYTLVNQPAGAAIDASGIITWTPSQNQSPGTNIITTVVTNTDPYDVVNPHLSATNSFTVVVREVNVAPVLPTLADQTIDELTLLTVTNAAFETNIHSTMGYTLVSPPAGAAIDANGIITWTPSQDQSPGTNTITTLVTNSNPYDLVNPQLSATNSFTVVVREVNVAPVLPTLADQTIDELTLLTVTNAAFETNIHSTLGYTLVNPPAGAAINGNGIITWTPSQDQSPSTNTITTLVTNSNPYDLTKSVLSVSNSFIVVVREVNVAPVLPVIADQTVNELTRLTVTNTAFETNVHSMVGYTLVNPPAGAAIDADGIITWTPGESQSPGTNTITTVATNSNPYDLINPHLSATNSFSVLVREVPPVLPVISDRTINELTLLIVTNSASAPGSPPEALTYQLVAPPTGASIDTNGVVSWTPNEEQGPGTNVITTVVTDDTGVSPLSATNSFTVVVNEVNSPPVLPPQTNRTIIGLAALTVTNTATDPDLPTNSLTYNLTPALANAVIDTNGVITLLPEATQVPSTNVVTTVVTDLNPWAVNAQHLSATNSFTVFVQPLPLAPVIESMILSNGVGTLRWSAETGQNYRLQCRDDLRATNWNDLLPDVRATGPDATAEVSITVSTQRFYRVFVVP
jgi:large repetitive protein